MSCPRLCQLQSPSNFGGICCSSQALLRSFFCSRVVWEEKLIFFPPHLCLLGGGISCGVAAAAPQGRLPLGGACWNVPVIGARRVLYSHPSCREVRVRLQRVAQPKRVCGGKAGWNVLKWAPLTPTRLSNPPLWSDAAACPHQHLPHHC